jgi:hypothetical protein
MHTWWSGTWEGPNPALHPGCINGIYKRNANVEKNYRIPYLIGPKEMTVNPATRTRQNHEMQTLLTDGSSRQ